LANNIIKYITINDVLYKIEEYSYKGYGGSRIVSNNMVRVPKDEVEKIKTMVEKQGEKIPNRRYTLTCDRKR